MRFVQLSFFDKDYLEIIHKVNKVKEAVANSFKRLATKIDSVVKKSRGWEYKEISFVTVQDSILKLNNWKLFLNIPLTFNVYVDIINT